MNASPSHSALRLMPWLVAVLLTGCAAPRQEVAEMGVTRVVNHARFKESKSVPWCDVKRGTILRPGAIIQTADLSRLDICFFPFEISSERFKSFDRPPAAVEEKQKQREAMNGGNELHVDWLHITTNEFMRLHAPTVIRVWGQTTVELEKSSGLRTRLGKPVREEAQFKLRQGHIFCLARQASGDSNFEMRIPNGTARFGAGIYDLSAEGLARVVLGRMVLAYTRSGGAAETVEIPAGMEFDARTGQMIPLSDYY